MKRIKRDYSLTFLCLMAVVASFALLTIVPLEPISQAEFTLILLWTVAVIYLHEVVHYAFIRFALKKWAKLTTLLRRGALMVEYDRLTAKEYVLTSLAPLFTIQLPLTAAAVATGSAAFIIPAVLHGTGSIADVFYSLRLLTTCRSCRVELYREGGRVKGYVIVKPDGDELVYII